MTRQIRVSKTYQDELESLLEQGMLRFGPDLVEQKRDRVNETIEYLADYPKRPKDRFLDIWSYQVSDVPFVLLYDFDESELRVHLIVHASADRTQVDLSSVEW